MFSSGGTDNAPFAANCIMFEGSLEARIRSICRGISSPPRTIRTGQVRSRFEFPDRKFQFSNQPVRFAKKFLQQSPIVPKSPLASAAETVPDGLSNFAVVGKNGAHVVEFVCSRNQSGLRVGTLEVPDILFFALPPRWLRVRVRIGTAIHNLRDAAPESPSHFFQQRRTAAVFH